MTCEDELLLLRSELEACRRKLRRIESKISTLSTNDKCERYKEVVEEIIEILGGNRIWLS